MRHVVPSITLLVALSFAEGLSACADTDTRHYTEASTAGVVEAEQVLAPVTGSMQTHTPAVLLATFEFRGNDVRMTSAGHGPAAQAGALRTVRQASWCQLAPLVDVDYVYSETFVPPAIIDLPLADAFACQPSSEATPSRYFGARCLDMVFENLTDQGLRDVFAVIWNASTGNGFPWPTELPARILALEGSGDVPPYTLGAFHIGDIEPHGTTIRRWAFRRSDGSLYTFTASLYAFVDEVCNGIDDDCDGDVDEGDVCAP